MAPGPKAHAKATSEESSVSASGLTFDTGMLIALERKKDRPWRIYREATRAKVRITVPTVVVTEWWRGSTLGRLHVLSSVVVEPLLDSVARLAGEALASVRRSSAIDAIVMASAALRGDVVYTSDEDDLGRLTSFFPGVHVIGV